MSRAIVSRLAVSTVQKSTECDTKSTEHDMKSTGRDILTTLGDTFTTLRDTMQKSTYVESRWIF